MEIQLDWDWLKTQKLFLATPMYGGLCYGTYQRAVCELVTMMNQRGLQLQLYSLFNESLITRARAYACDEFLRSDCTHLLFIDSDIGFNPMDIIVMWALMKDETEYDVLGAPYPKKCISWEKIKVACDKGFADKDPRALEQFVGDFVFNPEPGITSFSVIEPAPMLEVGTGFMMIKRKVFDSFRNAFPEYGFFPDHVRTEHFDGSREVWMYFQAEIDRPFLERPFKKALEDIVRLAENGEENTKALADIASGVLAMGEQTLNAASRRYLSEDYFFCQRARAVGHKVWLLPWIQTTHTGTHIYGGSVGAMGALGVSATADPEMLGKKHLVGKDEPGAAAKRVSKHSKQRATRRAARR